MTIFIVITLHGKKNFSNEFPGVEGGGGGGRGGGVRVISVCRVSGYREIGWDSLCFALYLFVYLFSNCLFIYFCCVCFLFPLRELFIESCISYMV